MEKNILEQMLELQRRGQAAYAAGNEAELQALTAEVIKLLGTPKKDTQS